MNLKIDLNIKHLEDYRNYKVNIDKAQNTLSFKPRYDIDKIVQDLIDNYEKFKDMKNPKYYNIEVFRKMKLQ